MGTRSLTYMYEDNMPLVCMYRQFDGYLSGHGSELAEFLSDIKMVNGIGVNAPSNIANGAGCLAAQLVSHFKTDPGGIYIVPADTDRMGIDYVYQVHVNGDSINVKVEGYEGKFSGTVEQFAMYCESEDE